MKQTFFSERVAAPGIEETRAIAEEGSSTACRS
jgi:hypothetical protein